MGLLSTPSPATPCLCPFRPPSLPTSFPPQQTTFVKVSILGVFLGALAVSSLAAPSRARAAKEIVALRQPPDAEEASEGTREERCEELELSGVSLRRDEREPVAHGFRKVWIPVQSTRSHRAMPPSSNLALRSAAAFQTYLHLPQTKQRRQLTFVASSRNIRYLAISASSHRSAEHLLTSHLYPSSNSRWLPSLTSKVSVRSSAKRSS